MKIAIGNDHAGFEDPPPHFKPEIVRHLENLGHEVVDCGCHDGEAVDYPDYADKVAEAVITGEAELGLLLCGTGTGMSMRANRHSGIRAATCATTEAARLSREHNHSNVLCIGSRIISLDEARAIIDTWLSTPWSDAERHIRRVNKIDS